MCVYVLVLASCSLACEYVWTCEWLCEFPQRTCAVVVFSWVSQCEHHTHRYTWTHTLGVDTKNVRANFSKKAKWNSTTQHTTPNNTSSSSRRRHFVVGAGLAWHWSRKTIACMFSHCRARYDSRMELERDRQTESKRNGAPTLGNPFGSTCSVQAVRSVCSWLCGGIPTVAQQLRRFS